MKINVAIQLATNDIINNINEVINKYNLPVCLIERIIDDLNKEIHTLSDNELTSDMEQYFEELRKEEKKKNKKEKESDK